MKFVDMYEEKAKQYNGTMHTVIGLGLAMLADSVVLVAESITEIADALAVAFTDEVEPEDEEAKDNPDE